MKATRPICLFRRPTKHLIHSRTPESCASKALTVLSGPQYPTTPSAYTPATSAKHLHFIYVHRWDAKAPVSPQLPRFIWRLHITNGSDLKGHERNFRAQDQEEFASPKEVTGRASSTRLYRKVVEMRHLEAERPGSTLGLHTCELCDTEPSTNP